MRRGNQSSLTVWLLLLGALIPASTCRALDNPDAPDYVAEFRKRAAPIEAAIQYQDSNIANTAHAYIEYEKFLDQELNQAYTSLMQRLNADGRQHLLDSQKRWLQFRDAEFQFIAANWTRENFGTSSVLSSGGYRARLIKDRVLQLLDYLKNY